MWCQGARVAAVVAVFYTHLQTITISGALKNPATTVFLLYIKKDLDLKLQLAAHGSSLHIL